MVKITLKLEDYTLKDLKKAYTACFGEANPTKDKIRIWAESAFTSILEDFEYTIDEP